MPRRIARLVRGWVPRPGRAEGRSGEGAKGGQARSGTRAGSQQLTRGQEANAFDHKNNFCYKPAPSQQHASFVSKSVYCVGSCL
jgi:hypothetical protein